MTGSAGDHDIRLDRAEKIVRRQSLLWAEADFGRTAEEALDSGCFLGADECARVLATVAPLEVTTGWGFGGAWPLLKSAGRTLAPAMPIAVSPERRASCDGEYLLVGSDIRREAVGFEDLFLTSDDSRPAPGSAFTIAWFGDTERFMVRDEWLEIEDLFGRLRVLATREVLEHHLIRVRRIEPTMVSTLPMAEGSAPQVVEVRRPAVLVKNDGWRDPAAFLGVRTEIERAQWRGDAVEVRTVDGASAVFRCRETPGGWSLRLREGGHLFVEIRLESQGDWLLLSATLEEGVNGLAPGMRGRLVFDLRYPLRHR